MSGKEEGYVILDDDIGRFLIADVVESGLKLCDNRTTEASKNGLSAIPIKNFERNLCKKEIPMNEVKKNVIMFKKTVDSNNYVAEYSVSCAVCQNVCNTCKHVCVTCKSPCIKCCPRFCKNSSSDTYDFDKYLESQSRKVKIQPKVKTIGTDTCDLEGHFDYYNFEKKTVRIQKSVGTDCIDLNLRVSKSVAKKPSKNTVAVDTSDLPKISKCQSTDDSDCEFFWTKKDETKTYIKKTNTGNSLINNEQKPCDDDVSENFLVIDEDSSCLPSCKEEEDNKENYNIEKSSMETTVDFSSTSDESDVDLITSCKVSKCRQLAKKHKITLKQINVDKTTLFKCSICEETFPKKHLGLLHIGNHIENNKFKCLMCNEKFRLLDLIISHVKKSNSGEVGHVKKTEEVVNDKDNCKENSKNDLIKQRIGKMYQCALCSNENESAVQFDSWKALYLHKKLKHGTSKSKSEREVKVEKKPRIKREFICLLCGKQFKSSKALKDHSPVHTGEKNYHCDICNKSYTTNANLKIHKRTHTGTRNFVCTVCGKAFHKKDSLKVHFRKHSGERPFQCDLCPMKFDRNYILKNHRYTHFSEKTFICPVCGKTFTTHGGLNNHEKGHKKDPFSKKPRKPAVKPTLDAENAVICDVCGKIYSTRSNLRIHKFVHLGIKPFECTICHQTYAKKDSMLTHMRKHTNERPFACETCGMTFYRNHTLKTHLLRHTGERPHKCKMCGKSFTQSSSLAYHVKNHDRKGEKKKLVADDSSKQKKKRINQNNAKSGPGKKIAKPIKSNSEFQTENVQPIYEEKKTVEASPEATVMKDPVHLNLTDKRTVDPIKGHLMFPVPEKEVLVLEKNLGVELPRTVNSGKEFDFYGLEKDVSYNNQYNLGKFNYYIAKSHVFSFPKEPIKSKNMSKEVEIPIDKNVEDMDKLIISKNICITKEGNLVTLNRESALKEVKGEFVHIEDQNLELKPQEAIPITGEILNAAFISDENGDVIPFSSMTLQGLNPENVMISPLIPVESDDRKAVLRHSKLTMLDPKITYNLTAPRESEKTVKGNCHVINLKDPRVPQKIQIELESPSLQPPVVEEGTLHGISGFYNNVQQNEM